MHLGATCFSVYNTSSPEQIEYVVGDADNRVIVTEQAFLDKVLEARGRVEGLEHVVVIDGEAPEGTISIEELEAIGEPDFDFEAAWRAVEPEDVLCLIYTSGTTGPPKGVQLTHANMLAVWSACHAVGPVRSGGRSISFLPSAHIADRWAAHYGQMLFGNTPALLPGSARDGRLLDRGEADDLGRCAADLGETEGGAGDGDGRRAGRGETRGRRVGDGDRAPPRRRLHGGRGPGRPAGRMGRGRREGLLEDPLPARPRRDRMVRRRCGADPAGGARVLPRDRDRDLRDLGDVGDERDHDDQPPGPGPCRHRRPTDTEHRGEARRGWRDHGSRAAGDEGVPQPAGEDGRSADRGRLAADRRRRRNGRGRLRCGSSTARRS